MSGEGMTFLVTVNAFRDGKYDEPLSFRYGFIIMAAIAAFCGGYARNFPSSGDSTGVACYGGDTARDEAGGSRAAKQRQGYRREKYFASSGSL